MQLLLVPSHLLDTVWGLILPGLENVQRHSAEDSLIEDVRQALLKGAAHLYVGFNPDYVGFMILKPEKSYSGVRSLHIWCLYSKGAEIDPDFVAEMARQYGVKTVTFRANRKGYLRKSFGFKPVYTVYRREL